MDNFNKEFKICDKEKNKDIVKIMNKWQYLQLRNNNYNNSMVNEFKKSFEEEDIDKNQNI